MGAQINIEEKSIAGFPGLTPKSENLIKRHLHVDLIILCQIQLGGVFTGVSAKKHLT